MTEAVPRKSDLGVRVLSAVVMVVVAGTALWLGGYAWGAFVLVIAAGVLWEWRGLTTGFTNGVLARISWTSVGLGYIGLAAGMLLFLRSEQFTFWGVATLLLAVIGTDVGAYFAGRTFGGPKIAPAISPSKTWSGLVGGMAGATLALFAISFAHVQQMTEATSEAGFYTHPFLDWGTMPWAGMVVALLAQGGDFFESWMKRRAGVKDSGTIIPGHGGLFDRVDGLISVLFALSVVTFLAILTSR